MILGSQFNRPSPPPRTSAATATRHSGGSDRAVRRAPCRPKSSFARRASSAAGLGDPIPPPARASGASKGPLTIASAWGVLRFRAIRAVSALFASRLPPYRPTWPDVALIRQAAARRLLRIPFLTLPPGPGSTRAKRGASTRRAIPSRRGAPRPPVGGRNCARHAKPSCRPWSCSAGHGGPGAGPGELVWPPLLKQLLPDASQPFGQLPPGGFAAAPGAPAGTQ